MRRWWFVVALLVAGGCTSDSAPRATTTTTAVPAVGAEPMAEAPIAGRMAAGAVWTGTEVLVWGGLARSGGITEVSDGAAYDPASDSWRTMAPPPTHSPAVGPAVAWTGTEAVFWAGNSPDGPTVGVVYDPKADRWRSLPDGPLGPREGAASAWTGTELILVGGAAGDTIAKPLAAAVDPATGRWRLLPSLNRYLGLAPLGALWDGDEVLVSGNLYLCPQLESSCHDTRPVFLAYDPAADIVREIDLHGQPALQPLGRSGTDVIFLNSTADGIVRYTRDGRWRAGKVGPCRPDEDGYEQQAWLGDRLVLACGEDRLQVYDLATDSWRVVQVGATPLGSRTGGTVVWTGTRLVAWSGNVYQPGNPTPPDGVVIDLSF